MTEIFSTIRLMAMIGGGLLFALLILLSLPHSRLKEIVQPIIGYTLAGLSVAYAISPLDGIPDVIPFVGWADDVVVLVVGVASAIAAMTVGDGAKQLR